MRGSVKSAGFQPFGTLLLGGGARTLLASRPGACLVFLDVLQALFEFVDVHPLNCPHADGAEDGIERHTESILIIFHNLGVLSNSFPELWTSTYQAQPVWGKALPFPSPGGAHPCMPTPFISQ